MNMKRQELQALNDAYDLGHIGQCEYEIRKAELLVRSVSSETEEGDDDMNNVSTHRVLVATDEQQFCDLAAEIRAMYPETVEEDWATQSIDRQLEMMASQSIQLLERPLSYLAKAIPDAEDALKKCVEEYDGSEVKTQVLERKTNWVKQLRAQKAFTEERWGTEEELAAAKLAYKQYFGKTWVPYSGKKKADVDASKVNTAAMAEAKAALGITE